MSIKYMLMLFLKLNLDVLQRLSGFINYDLLDELFDTSVSLFSLSSVSLITITFFGCVYESVALYNSSAHFSQLRNQPRFQEPRQSWKR